MFLDAYTLPPDKLARAIRLAHIRNVIEFGSTAWMLLFLWLTLHLRWAAGIRDWAASITSRRWLQGFIFIPVFLLLLSLAPLPFEIWGHHTSLTYGLSIESWPAWAWDLTKSLLLTIGVGTPLLVGLVLLIRRSESTWWFWTWLIAQPLQIAGIFLIPYVIDPLFNHFEPLAKSDPALVEQLERVVARSHANIPPSRMFLMNASEKVTGLNAYVTGFGNSKRIVIWDTTIAKSTPDEILFIFAHEQGHYALNHIRKGMLFSAIGLFIGLFLGDRITRWLIRRYSNDWHIANLDDWAALVVLALVFLTLEFVSEPVTNGFSRAIEHQADVYGQEAVHGIIADPQQTGVRTFQVLGETSLDEPNPNPLLVFWAYSHPSISQRADFAAHYDPWKPGRRPRYFPAESRPPREHQR
jgi:Zn-dependent protease with chaperone function